MNEEVVGDISICFFVRYMYKIVDTARKLFPV